MAVKYGEDNYGWLPAIPREVLGCGVWKGICSVKEWFSRFIRFKVNKGDRISFRHDLWCTNVPLALSFPSCYRLAQNKWGFVKDHMIRTIVLRSSNLSPRRNLNNWKVEEMGRPLNLLENYPLGDRDFEDELI